MVKNQNVFSVYIFVVFTFHNHRQDTPTHAQQIEISPSSRGRYRPVKRG